MLDHYDAVVLGRTHHSTITACQRARRHVGRGFERSGQRCAEGNEVMVFDTGRDLVSGSASRVVDGARVAAVPYSDVAGATPLGRLGVPGDLVDAEGSLISDASRSVTGRVRLADGSPVLA